VTQRTEAQIKLNVQAYSSLSPKRFISQPAALLRL